MGARGTAFSAVLQRLTAAGEPCLGSAVERIEQERVIDRPFSTVLRARVTTRRGEVVVYCKLFRSPVGDPTSMERLRFRVEREFRETGRAYDIFAGKPGFAPLQPLAIYPDLLAIVTREVKGDALTTLLSRTARRWSRGGLDPARAAARRVGQWLRIYQTMPNEPQQLAIGDLRDYVDTRLQRLAREHAGGFTAARRQQILAEFDACAGMLGSEELTAVPVHADFCPDNILVHHGAISVIDFAMAKRALRHLDLSHLLIHLDFRSGILWDREAIGAIRESMLEGYGEPAVAETPGFRLAVLVHVSALMMDRFNRASRLRGARNMWLAPQIRRCLEFVHA